MVCSMWYQVRSCDGMQVVKDPHLLWACGFSEVLKCVPHFEPAGGVWLCQSVGSGLQVLLLLITCTGPRWGSSNERQEGRCLALPTLGRQQLLDPGTAWPIPKHLL